MEEKEKAIVGGISLYPEEWIIISDLDGSRSAAVRRIIREWHAIRSVVFLIQAYQCGMLLPEDAAQRFLALAESADIPVPYTISAEQAE